MTRTLNRLFHLLNFLVSGTGAVYALMIYLLHPREEWSVVNHPWQPHFQHAHLLLAPGLVFLTGAVLVEHVLPKLRAASRRGRFSGLSLLFSFGVMAASGYLVQTSIQPSWSMTWKQFHLWSSILWIGFSIVHLVRSRGRAFSAPKPRKQIR